MLKKENFVRVGWAIQDAAGNFFWYDSETAKLGNVGMFMHKERAEMLVEKWNQEDHDVDAEHDEESYTAMIESGIPPEGNKLTVVEVFVRQVDWNRTNNKNPLHKPY